MIDSLYDTHDTGERRGFVLGRNRGRMFKGGTGGDTTQVSKMEPSAEVKPYLGPYMEHAAAIAQTPYQSYGGQQIAGFTQDQLSGFDMTRDHAFGSQQLLGVGNNQLMQTASGGYSGYTPGTNSYLGKETQVGTNALLGMDNPYLNKAIQSSMGDITTQFNNSVANNTDAMMARSGAFGGSAWQQAQTENANQLAQNLGRTSNDMRMTDYALQAQLQEADVARRMNASQTDLARNSALEQSGIQLGDAAYQAERARQLQATGMLPSLQQAGYQNAQALLGSGDAQQAMNQSQLDLLYNNWLQEQNYPQQQLDIMGRAIGTTMGSGGTQTTTGNSGVQRNSTASALGGALSGAAAGTAIMPGWGTAIGAGVGLLGGMF